MPDGPPGPFGPVLDAAPWPDAQPAPAAPWSRTEDALPPEIARLAEGAVTLFKGGLILVAAGLVAVQIISRLLDPVLPAFDEMGLFSLLALAANSVCLFLLWRHRHEDVNMSSVWECSRNDIATNLSVLMAAGAVWLTGSGWPDIVVASGLVALLLHSTYRVIRAARLELR